TVEGFFGFIGVHPNLRFVSGLLGVKNPHDLPSAFAGTKALPELTIFEAARDLTADNALTHTRFEDAALDDLHIWPELGAHWAKPAHLDMGASAANAFEGDEDDDFGGSERLALERPLDAFEVFGPPHVLQSDLAA